jgi:hypothetical protein
LVENFTNLQIHVFGPLKILHHTETMGLLIPPDALKPRAILERAD